MKIEKHQSETYYIANNGQWAYFTICTELGSLAVNSSYGVLGFTWPAQRGENFKNWLTEDPTTDYVLNKLTYNTRLAPSAERNFDKFLLAPFFEAVQRELIGAQLEPPPATPTDTAAQSALAL